MKQSKDVHFGKKFRYSQSNRYYEFRLRNKRCWWWLLLLLLLLPLLVRCEHDLTVTCIDRNTQTPLPDIPIAVDYTSHLLYKDGYPLVSEKHHLEGVTDSSGNVTFKKLEYSIYSYIFYRFSKIVAEADGRERVSRLFHPTRHIVIELGDLECDVDIVMCIDDTGSMDKLLSMVKANAIQFGEDLKKHCHDHRRDVKHMRLKVFSFGDLKQKAIDISPFYNMPEEMGAYQQFVNNIVAWDGDDNPESGLEALALAINTPWVASSTYPVRHVIVVYTDASAHALDNPTTRGSVFYPVGMPNGLEELKQRWDAMDQEARRLVLFAPNEYPWTDISSDWDEVFHLTKDLSVVLDGKGYNQILEAICKSL